MADITYTHPALNALEGRLTVSVEEAGAILGIGRSAAYEATHRGEIPCRRLGRRIVIPVPLLLDWLGLSPAAA
jgi:excisionase family DNA binding protein